MYEPAAHDFYPPIQHWDAPRRRRRLNGKGYAVLLLALVVMAGLFLGALKISLAIWNSPLTPQLVKSAAKVGSVAADAAMKEAKVPEKVRKTALEEAERLSGVAMGSPGGEAAGGTHDPAPAAAQP